MKTRSIQDQLKDIIEGRLTIDQVLAEGVDSYAIKFYDPQDDECEPFYAMRKIYKEREATKPVDHTAELREFGYGEAIQNGFDEAERNA